MSVAKRRGELVWRGNGINDMLFTGPSPGGTLGGEFVFLSVLEIGVRCSNACKSSRDFQNGLTNVKNC